MAKTLMSGANCLAADIIEARPEWVHTIATSPLMTPTNSSAAPKRNDKFFGFRFNKCSAKARDHIGLASMQ